LISQGKLARYVVLRNTYPAGTTAECDYLSSFFYIGPPPETTPESTSAAWAAAKAGTTCEAFLTNLNSIARNGSGPGFARAVQGHPGGRVFVTLEASDADGFQSGFRVSP